MFFSLFFCFSQRKMQSDVPPLPISCLTDNLRLTRYVLYMTLSLTLLVYMCVCAFKIDTYSPAYVEKISIEAL